MLAVARAVFNEAIADRRQLPTKRSDYQRGHRQIRGVLDSIEERVRLSPSYRLNRRSVQGRPARAACDVRRAHI